MTKRSIAYLEELRHTPHICLAEGLRSANRAITKLYAEHMAGSEVGPAQASLLMRLYYLRKATMLQLAHHMETDRTTMTRNVDLLVRGGFVEISVDEDDRRSRLVSLTDKGFKALENVLPKWRQVQEELKKSLGHPLWLNLLSDLRVLTSVGESACDRSAR